MLNNHRRAVNLTVILGFILLTTALTTYGASMRGTHALFTDTEVITGNTFTTGTWETNVLVLSPGTSQATYVTTPGPFPPIARLDENGQLKLDFGEIPAGNSNNSPDVFRIKNTSAQLATVEFKLSDNLIPLFFWVRLEGDNNLAPGQEKKVEMKLDTAPATPLGIYEGFLTISCGAGYSSTTIPVRFEVFTP